MMSTATIVTSLVLCCYLVRCSTAIDCSTCPNKQCLGNVTCLKEASTQLLNGKLENGQVMCEQGYLQVKKPNIQCDMCQDQLMGSSCLNSTCVKKPCQGNSRDPVITAVGFGLLIVVYVGVVIYLLWQSPTRTTKSMSKTESAKKRSIIRQASYGLVLVPKKFHSTKM